MSKVMQEHYLVVYQQEKDFIEKLECFKSKAFEGKYLYKVKDRKIIIKTEYGTQECYYFKQYTGRVDYFWESIAGAHYVAPLFLNGDYPSILIMRVLSRCRGGILEVDAI